eukprot:355167-Rhodomonas_salina.2
MKAHLPWQEQQHHRKARVLTLGIEPCLQRTAAHRRKPCRHPETKFAFPASIRPRPPATSRRSAPAQAKARPPRSSRELERVSDTWGNGCARLPTRPRRARIHSACSSIPVASAHR